MRSLAIASCFALACSSFAQSFEVASVKLAPPPDAKGGVFIGAARGGPGTKDPGQITWNGATLTNLLIAAYEVKRYQIKGPDWLATERYDIIAKVPAGATKEQIPAMWQRLLQERFGMQARRESKE